MDDWARRRARLIGLGRRSLHKSYYPELKARLGDLERFRALLEHSNELIFLVRGPDGVIVDVNRAVMKSLGYESDQLLGARIDQLLVEDLSAHLVALFSEADPESGLGARPVLTSLRAATGEQVHVEITARSVPIDGQTYGVIVGRDIRDRMAAERALRASQDRFRDFSGTTADWFWETGADMRLLYLSERFESLAGVRPDYVLGRKATELFSANHVDSIPELVAHEPFENVELARLGVGRKKNRISISGKPFFDERGEFRGYRGICRDVSEQRRMEELVRFSQTLLTTSLETISHGICVVDTELKLVAWNPRYMELFGYPQGFIRHGMPIEEVLRYNAAQGRCGPGELDDHVNKRLEHLRQGTAHVFQRRQADGRVIEMTGHALPTGGYVTTFSDITEHVEAKEDLELLAASLEERVAERTAEISSINEELLAAKQTAERANLEKTRFIAAAGHDILQPLNAARLFAHATEETAQGAEQKQLARRLNDSLDAAEELMSTLFDIAKLDQGALQPSTAALDLGQLLDPLAAQFDSMAQAKGIDFRYRPIAVHVWSDHQYLRRILQNLISNAVKYTEAGRVLVGVRRSKGGVRVEVWDTGVGIEPNLLDAIFRDFYRVESAPGSGSGLGLAVVRRMAKLLGHPLHVRSWPGRGSCFMLELPRAPSEVADSPVAPEELPDKSETGTRVIYLDDEIENIEALRAVVEPWGVELHGAENLEAALACARTLANPSLLIVDYQLAAGSNGLEAAQEIQATLQSPPPTVITTASRDPSVKQLARNAGFSFLPKPIKPGALRALLRAATGTRASPTSS